MPESSRPVVVEVPLFDFDDELLDAATPAPDAPAPAAPAPGAPAAATVVAPHSTVNSEVRVGSVVVLERDAALTSDDTIVLDVDAAAVLETGRAAVLEDLEEAVRAAPEAELVVDTEITLPLVPRPAWADRLAVFDLETTGIDVETSRVVTANISLLDAAGQVVSRRDWLADPGVPIPEQATAVHGVSTEHARAAGRPAAEVVAEIVAELRRVFDEGYALVVYNAPYDLTLLNREALRHGGDPLVTPPAVIDPLVIDKQIDRYRKGKRTLEVSAAFYGVALTDAHDAGADAIAAGRVAQALAAKYAVDLDLSLDQLHAAQVAWHDAQSDSFEDYMRRTRDPTFTSRRGWPESARPA
ncbi:exonuclease domain-containing protein [Herbiconiux ginsengi]|uniref:DNA polymerase III, epsilon subunit n=1 Tax=Herbiconiux ginsengi TaxID=381665 RepID=A0A1H3PWS1_9MICO|nr:DNA polymerase III, epsilon subunit [Herbiconiux ginsengi]